MNFSKKFVLILPLALLLISGCVDIPRTITKESPLWGGYGSKEKYQIVRDAFIMVVDDGLEPKRLALCPEGEFKKHARFYSVPTTIEDYEKDPENAVVIKLEGGGSYKVIVAGIVRAGTTIQCTRLRQHRGLNWFYGSHNQITIYAKFLNGEHQGKEVDLQDVSDSYEKKGVWLDKPNSQLLKKI
jgi:hypothetical protein